MKFIQRLLKALTLPLERFFYVFITLFILHALVDTIYFYIYPIYSINVFFHGLFMAYILTIPCIWLEKHKGLFTAYKWIIFVPYLISFAGDLIAHATLGSSLDEDVAATILATNMDEAKECFQTYFSILPILIGGVVLFATYKLYKYLKKVACPFKYLWLMGIAAGAYVTYNTTWLLVGGVTGKTAIFLQAKSPIELEDFCEKANITAHLHEQPQHVVMIVGESLTKHHCSSYGYPKSTTPKLEALADSGLLYTFKNVKSEEVHTLPVFKTLFSKYRNEWKDSVDWFRCPTLQDILHQSGYKTFWVSNQSKRGVCDNFIGKYADLCSENYFVGNKLAGMKRRTYDEEVIDLTRPLIDDTLQNNFYVVHLMGSHFKFDKRYPEQFDHYQAEDYPDLADNQKKVVATYDNSVIYNDSVVYEVMQLFKDKEAIVFYFSDHAIDLFQSTDDYYGHSKSNKESFVWGQEIPFYVYMSPKYQAKYPEVVEAIKRNVERPFRTDNMFYTIMDVIGSKFKGNDEVKQFTLLQ